MDTIKNPMIGNAAKASPTTAIALAPKSHLQKIAESRITMSEAVRLVGQIVRGYPNGGNSAGKGYVGAMAEVLTRYPVPTATRAADPYAGVTRSCPDFLPTVPQLIAWCEKDADGYHRAIEREMRVAQQIKNRPPAAPSPSLKPGQYSYRDFLDLTADRSVKPRPIGVFEDGGYLGRK